MSARDDIRYYLPTWSANSGPKWRTASWLSEVIHGNAGGEPRRRIGAYCDAMVADGELMRICKHNSMYYAHKEPRS